MSAIRTGVRRSGKAKASTDKASSTVMPVAVESAPSRSARKAQSSKAKNSAVRSTIKSETLATKSGKPSKAGKSSKSEKAAKSGKAAKPGKAAKTVDTSKPAKAAEAAKAALPVKAAKSAKPVPTAKAVGATHEAKASGKKAPTARPNLEHAQQTPAPKLSLQASLAVTPKPDAAMASTGDLGPAIAAALASAVSQKPAAKGSESQGGNGQLPVPDFEALSKNMARLVEEGGKAVAAYMKPLEEGRTNPDLAEHVEDAVKTFGHVAEHWLSDPKRTIDAQSHLTGDMLELWSRTLKRFNGEKTEPVRAPDPSDKRFSDPEWVNNPLYDFLRQAYVITTEWANGLVTKADTVDAFTREKAQFYLRQIAGAVSPSNFIATNPELLRTTLAQSGENLVRGMHMLAEDIEAGHGQLKIRQSDASKLLLGRDMAATPGKVVFRNDLMELIQYNASTETVLKRPLLVVPPWINKFYVLDLNPEKSFVRWAVSQGLTVFVISWVNPDERHAAKSFEDYMREGVMTALEQIEVATGERKAATIGYCVGGTLLAITLAYMAAQGDDRIDSATFLTTQVDFSDAGELKLFVDKVRIKAIEEKMAETGYLEGSKMATAFNMLRPNELIWSYVVNNYLKGKEPMPFDLLSWNSDSTRMPAANHSFYLRNCYLENNLTGGRMVIDGVTLDLKKVKTPVYHLATREDHIAPARSVYTGAAYFGGPVRYVLAGSGHIAGVVNPASKPKYQFWAGPAVTGSFDDWLKEATETPGTWWGDWIGWLSAQAPERVPAREPGGGKLTPICDAPGEYVRMKA
ncbi:MAG: class poly(R)-hydroxyalkanoic acid synthase [Hyphomicrobiales bacterium]|nr:class poly(R)-hydroxyalkanoic acid synthase [Hyphomicrobiales bacterium]